MKIIYTHAGHSHTLTVERTTNGVEIQTDGEHETVHLLACELPRVSFLRDGTIHTARVVTDGKKQWVHYNGNTFVLERGTAGTARAIGQEREGAGSGIVTAPMPGQVRGVLAHAGDWVEEGQALFLLEAMKMEIRVTATRAGQIVQLNTIVGQTVEREEVLAVIQEAQNEDE